MLNENGVVPLIAALGASDSADGREQAAAALAKLARQHKVAQRTIAAAGGIPPLITILKARRDDDTSEGREYAAAALSELAVGTDNRDAIVATDGLPPLISLLRTGGAVGKTYCASALARLSPGHQPTARMIGELDAIEPLVARAPLLGERAPRACTHGVAPHACGMRIARAQVELLSGGFGEEAQEEGAGALLSLADLAENRVATHPPTSLGALRMQPRARNSR